jgi:hypothetical protein
VPLKPSKLESDGVVIGLVRTVKLPVVRCAAQVVDGDIDGGGGIQLVSSVGIVADAEGADGGVVLDIGLWGRRRLAHLIFSGLSRK